MSLDLLTCVVCAVRQKRQSLWSIGSTPHLGLLEGLLVVYVSGAFRLLGSGPECLCVVAERAQARSAVYSEELPSVVCR